MPTPQETISAVSKQSNLLGSLMKDFLQKNPLAQDDPEFLIGLEKITEDMVARKRLIFNQNSKQFDHLELEKFLVRFQ